MSGPMARQLCRAVPLLFLTAGVLSDAVAQALPAPVVTLAAGPKRIELSWPVVPGAAYYVVKESATTGAPFLAIAPRIAQGKAGGVLDYTRPISVHRQDWSNARFSVEACNQSLIPFCSRSIEQSAAALELDAIGYLGAAKADPADGFGMAVASSGDGSTLAIGGPTANGLSIEMVHVFARSAGSWRLIAVLTPSNADLGTSVALDANGGTLAVGSQRDDSDAAGGHVAALSCVAPAPGAVCDVGAVDIYTRSFTGAWLHAAYLRPSVFASEDLFGTAVALSADGRQLAVGAVGEDSTAVDSGAAYVFTRSGSSWAQEAFLKTSDADTDDAFGAALDFDDQGRMLAVSASLEDGGDVGVTGVVDEALTNAGAVFLFERSAVDNSWLQTRYIKAPNPGADDHFGGDFFRGAIALSGDATTLVAPAADEDGPNDATPDSGAAYLY